MTINDLQFIDSTGAHNADFPTYLNYFVTLFQGIYGNDVYIQPDSQDGQFLAALAQSAHDNGSKMVSAYNSFSPLTAQGVGLSRNVKINGIQRKIASFSTVQLTVIGVANTVISGGVAQDTLNQLWTLISPITIPIGGSIVVSATAQAIGAIFADVNTVNSIFTPTNGWQSVNNVLAAVLGAPVETDSQLRARQALSTSLPSLTVLEGTLGAVANVTGVTKVQNYENASNSTDVRGLPPHSICMVVAGGASAAIAKAIQIKKTPGTQTYAPTPTSVVVYDSRGIPITINYQIANSASAQVTINLVVGVGWTINTVPLIKAAVAAIINKTNIGGDNQIGLFYYTLLFPAAYLQGAVQFGTFDITGITTGKNNGAQSAANIAIGFSEVLVCDPLTDVVVNVA